MSVFLVLGSVISLQFGAAFASQLFGQIGAPGATALRLGIAALMLAVVARPKIRQETIVLGLTLAGMNGTFYLALDRIPLGVAVTIEFLGPLGLAAVLSRRPRDFVWVGLALVGIVVLGVREYTGAHLDLIGVALALFAAAFWACYVLAGRKVATAGLGIGGLAGASLIAAALTLPYGLSAAGATLFEPRILLLGTLVALLASAIPYALEIKALRTLEASTFGVVLALEPAAAALAGALLLGQHLSVISLGGMALVITAGVGAALRRAPAPRGTPARRDADLVLPVPQ
ncbi:EamA family transporter [Lentzea albidocapillata]|uniref:Inner membrane transporter RhtA n=1 Tax=Lentzea albidocapillata TaxID=40571 RepID=A0A1W2FF84_9PSEU|nr:EamA family transporter [Lentzea albidocapillata]SMD20739.1 inner membrane transporter RhtA [Lentzea albidocapillata]